MAAARRSMAFLSSHNTDPPRQILHLSKRLPDPVKRAAAVSATQDKFRQHWSAGDDEAARAGLKAEAESRLGFLKMMTPSALHRGASRSGGRWLYRDGEKVSTDEISKLPVSHPLSPIATPH